MHIYTYRWILRFSIFPKIFKGPSSTWMRVFENHKVRITPKTKGKPYCAVIHSAYLVLIIPFKSFHGKPVVSKGRSWPGNKWWVGEGLILLHNVQGMEIEWKKWQPPPVFLPGEPHGQRSLVGSSPRGGKESDMIEWLTLQGTDSVSWFKPGVF